MYSHINKIKPSGGGVDVQVLQPQVSNPYSECLFGCSFIFTSMHVRYAHVKIKSQNKNILR
jgi:hypothetical protein